MRWDNIYVNACAVALGRREDTSAAVADGRYDRDFQKAHGYESISVAGAGPVVDMAVAAGRQALSRSDIAAADIGMLIHTYTTPQGPDHIQPASYIQGKTIGGRARAVEVRQACNGGMAALEMACMYVSVAPERSAALLTTSDKHQEKVDRYRCDPGNVPGDGATGLVLSRHAGVARVLSTEIIGAGEFSAPPAVDPRQYTDRRAFHAEQRRRLLPMLTAMAEAQRDCIANALADSDTKSGDIARWVFANSGSFLANRDLYDTFGIEEARTTWNWGRTIGHFSAGDQVAGLTHLLETGTLQVGDRVALFGNGVGFSYGCAVLEIVGKPKWPVDREY